MNNIKAVDWEEAVSDILQRLLYDEYYGNLQATEDICEYITELARDEYTKGYLTGLKKGVNIYSDNKEGVK